MVTGSPGGVFAFPAACFRTHHAPHVFHAACFQNITLLLDSSWPQFTACFQSSVLVLVPNGFLWCALLPYLPYLLAQPPGQPLASSWHNAAKTVRVVGVGAVFGGGGGFVGGGVEEVVVVWWVVVVVLVVVLLLLVAVVVMVVAW